MISSFNELENDFNDELEVLVLWVAHYVPDISNFWYSNGNLTVTVGLVMAESSFVSSEFVV